MRNEMACLVAEGVVGTQKHGAEYRAMPCLCFVAIFKRKSAWTVVGAPTEPLLHFLLLSIYSSSIYRDILPILLIFRKPQRGCLAVLYWILSMWHGFLFIFYHFLMLVQGKGLELFHYFNSNLTSLNFAWSGSECRAASSSFKLGERALWN